MARTIITVKQRRVRKPPPRCSCCGQPTRRMGPIINHSRVEPGYLCRSCARCSVCRKIIRVYQTQGSLPHARCDCPVDSTCWDFMFHQTVFRKGNQMVIPQNIKLTKAEKIKAAVMVDRSLHYRRDEKPRRRKQRKRA